MIVPPWLGINGGGHAIVRAVRCRRIAQQRGAGDSVSHELVSELEKCLAGADVVVNMSPHAALNTLLDGYLNRHELCMQAVGNDPKFARYSCLERNAFAAGFNAAKLGDWAAARIQAERFMRFGSDARYASACFQGHGLTHYGPVCVFFTPPEGTRLTFYVGDSGAELKSSVAPDRPFDARFLVHGFVVGQHVAERIAEKFATSFIGQQPPYGLLLRALFQAGSDCIEVHVHGQLPANCVKGLRVCPQFAERMARDAERARGQVEDLAERQERGMKPRIPPGLDALLAFEALKDRVRRMKLSMTVNGRSIL